MVINALAIGYLLATTVWIWLDAVAAPWICRLSSSSSSSCRESVSTGRSVRRSVAKMAGRKIRRQKGEIGGKMTTRLGASLADDVANVDVDWLLVPSAGDGQFR